MNRIIAAVTRFSAAALLDWFSWPRSRKRPRRWKATALEREFRSPALRRRCQAGLNKGEAAHKLKRAVFFHERGEIRERSFESQAFRASGLNLVVSAIVHWNTIYIERAVTHLRSMRREIPDHLLRHISPLSWEHINLTGIYTWDSEQHLPEGFRSLRLPVGVRRAA